MSFDELTSLRLVGQALGMAHLLGEGVNPIVVRDVAVIDQSLTVEALAASADPMRLRQQAASIMGGLSGLDLRDLFPSIKFTHFAVRLCSSSGEELFWVLTSPADANFATSGAVRWLANSIFQDSTPAYRRSIADRQIGLVETALRRLLHTHWMERFGERYPEEVFSTTMLKDLRKSARREGEDESDGRALLDFTLLPQLSRLVREEMALTQHGCVENAAEADGRLAKLNKIRRKVAHHRPPSREDVEEAQQIAAELLAPIGRRHPDLVDDFLAERWDQAVSDLFQDMRRAGFSGPEPPEQGAVPDSRRLAIIVRTLDSQRKAAALGSAALRRLVVPPSRREQHDIVDEALRALVSSLAELVGVARSPDLSAAEAEAAHDRHQETLKRISELRQDIIEQRVMRSTE